jgi:hypothetical protein
MGRGQPAAAIRIPVNGQQRMELGPKLGVMGDHARSFAWLMLIIGTFLGTLTVVQNILVHFVFGNPTKVQQQALTLAILLTFDFQVATLGLFLIAGASQFVIAATASLLARSYGRRTQALALLAVPVVAVLTWYCFDYLTPSNMALIPGPDYVAYEHGLTPSRYVKIAAFQAAVTLFTVIYTATVATKIRRWLPFTCCGIAVGVGFGLAAVRAYPLWAKNVAATQTISQDVEKKTIPIVGGNSVRTIDWTADGKALLVRMILPDEIVTLKENGQSTMKLPPMWSLNAVNTVGTRVFTTQWSPNGSYLESLDLMSMHVERRFIDTVSNEDPSVRPNAYIGPSRSMRAIPFMSPLNIVRDRPHVVDFYDGATLAKIASFEFAVGQALPGLVSVSADGKTVAYSLPTSSNAGKIEVRSLPEGTIIGQLYGKFGSVVALSPDGRNIAVVEQRPKPDSTDKSTDWISVYDIASSRLTGAREILGSCKPERTEDDGCRNYLAPVWSPDGSFVAYADGPVGQNNLRIWHPLSIGATDRNIQISVPFNLISVAPDGAAVAVDDFDDSVTIVRTRSGGAL